MPRPTTASPTNLRPHYRRRLRLFVTLLTALIATLGIWATLVEPADLRVVEHDIDLPGWKQRPMRVVVLSDLHIGAPHMDDDYLAGLIERTNALRPELILIAGDFLITNVAGGEFVEPIEVARGLAGLKADLGVHVVLGNHDWWYDGPATAKALAAAGLNVLENASVILDRGNAKIRVIGIGDHMTRHDDAARAFREADPVDAPTLLFTHSPDLFPELAAMQLSPRQLSLAIAGHTHGGQVRLPFLGTPVVPSRYGDRFVRGHVQEGDAHYFITSGVGTSVLPIRFAVPPEIVLLNLR